MKAFHVHGEVEVPEGVEVKVEGPRVTMKGPKGVVTRDFSHMRGVDLRFDEANRKFVVEAFIANRRARALVGSAVAHLKNMIVGVTKGYRYKLKIIFSHFPVTVVVDKEKGLVRIRNFLGEKAERVAKIVGEQTTVRVEGEDVIVEGPDIEEVGQTAANIEMATKIKDKDRRVFSDGIYIYEKEVIA
ncbi:MAG: 50S ribosomal protein L6 [Desulfurococcaceae archaeon]